MRSLRGATSLFVAGFLLLQVAWLVTVPPFRGADEFDHAYRAAAVARGQWVADEPAVDGRGTLVAVPASLVEAASAQCSGLEYTGPDNCRAVARTEGGLVLVASSAGGYHPVFYWVVGSAARPFDGVDSLYAMRVVVALLCTLFVGLAAWASNGIASRWPLAALALAASPVLVYSTIVVAPNGVEMAAALSLWTSLLALRRGSAAPDPGVERYLLATAVLSGVTMSTLRLLGPIFVVLIVAAVLLFDHRGALAVVRRHRTAVTIGAVATGATMAGFVAWVLGPASTARPESPEGSSDFDLVTRALVWPLQAIAAFPFPNQAGAIIVYPIVVSLVALLLVVALRAGTRRDRIVVTIALAGALVLPFVATYVTLDDRGVIWQGRYGLPVGVGFILLAGAVIAERRAGTPLSVPTLVLGLSASAVGLIGCLLKVRHDELTDNPASAADPAWHAPSPAVLIVLVVVAVSLIGQALRQREPHEVTRA